MHCLICFKKSNGEIFGHRYVVEVTNSFFFRFLDRFVYKNPKKKVQGVSYTSVVLKSSKDSDQLLYILLLT